MQRSVTKLQHNKEYLRSSFIWLACLRFLGEDIQKSNRIILILQVSSVCFILCMCSVFFKMFFFFKNALTIGR